MKLMIVDDEYIIREGIKHAFTWENDRIEIVAEAGDGRNAVNKALQARPDIIICDIRMPFMDGISFVKTVQPLLPDAGFIMLTAYGEKDYMLNAIRLGVHDFLLKPAGLDEIRNTVLKVRDRIEREQELTAAVRQKSELAEENRALLLEHYFSSFIRGEQNAAKMEEVMELLEGNKTASGYRMLLLQSGSGGQWPLMQRLSEALARWNPRLIRLGELDLLLLRVNADENVGSVLEAMEKATDILGVRQLSEYADGLETLPEVFRAAKSRFEEELKAGQQSGEQVKKEEIQSVPAHEPWAEAGGHAGRALRYIQSHFEDPELQLEDVAKALYLSSAYLSRILNENGGKGFVGWLRHFRIEKAKELLETTSLKFCEISEKVGYKSYKVFSEHFTRETGSTLGQWKREGRRGQKK